MFSVSCLFAQQPSTKMIISKPVPNSMFETPGDFIDDLKFDNNEIYEENPNGNRAVARIFGPKIKKRRISDAEYEFARSIFNQEFPSKDKITITNLMSPADKNAFYVRPTMGILVGQGYIRMNMGKYFDNCLLDKKTFSHELTHVWQIEHYGVLKYFLDFLDNHVVYAMHKAFNDIIGSDPPKDAYGYTCVPNKTLGEYNFEQQGNIVRFTYSERLKTNYNTCEEDKVVSGIRKGTPFPIIRSPDCQVILNLIATNTAEIGKRKALFSKQVIITKASDSPTRKPIYGMVVDQAKLNADPTYQKLIQERNALVARQKGINCQ